VEVVSGLGKPTSHRATKVVEAHVLDTGSLANSEPRLADVHEVVAFLCVWQLEPYRANQA
jgi:hypothetical protein